VAEVAEAVLEQTWREKLLATLYALPSDAFERLCQRLLRESGFVQVKVTGRSGDGGIDGVGIVQLGGLLGFPVLFQCKRYRGSVGASAIRDFRGAMIGRADRGLVITTGTFSRDARAEATRDGAPPIDLVDGEQLLDKLRELRLGVGVKTIEEVTVLPEWFATI
jgi:restriction system protein